MPFPVELAVMRKRLKTPVANADKQWATQFL